MLPWALILQITNALWWVPPAAVALWIGLGLSLKSIQWMQEDF